MSNLPLKPVYPLDIRKSAIVVGGSSGLGAALVRLLFMEGYNVAAVARREAELVKLCNELNMDDSRATQANYYVHDVINNDDIPGLFQQITTDLGGLDLIVYTAAFQPSMTVNEYVFAKDKEMVQVNLLGAMAWFSQAAIRFSSAGMGHIVGVSSLAADRGRVLNPGYNSSKAALDTYLEGLRNRLSRKGVVVTTIKPGFVDTRLLENASKAFWVISPEKAAQLTFKAIRRRKQVAYIPGRWRFVGLVVRHIPSIIFRRLNF